MMKPDFKLLSRLVHDNALLVTFNREGIIGKVHFKERTEGGWTGSDYYAEILEGRKLEDLYRLPPGKPPEALAGKPHAFEEALSPDFLSGPAHPSKNIFENFETFNEFHSLIPFSHLQLKAVKGAGPFGIIRLNRIGEIANLYRNTPLVFLDASGAVKGVNRAFAGPFSSKGLSARDLLDEPAVNLMDGNPVLITTGNAEEFRSLGKGGWKSRDSADFPGAGRVMGKGLLPLLKPLDTARFDIRLELKFTLERGQMPSVIVGGIADHERFFPDNNGYLLGPDPFRRVFQIKKEGRVAHRAAWDGAVGGGRHTLAIIKRGFSMACFLDRRLLAGYRDPQFFTDRESCQYLLGREDSRILLHSLSLSTLPAEEAPDAFNQVSFLSGRENAYRFQPLVHDVTFYGRDFYYAFLFYNVSDLKRNITQLRASQAHMTRQRDKYKALALGKALESDVMIGESPVMLQLKKDVQKVAATPVTVLIEGETGTGKEVLARFDHASSPFRDGPFVKVDCASIPEPLLESELFGAEKGAFTGAAEARAGKLEAAGEGTVFLDELANLNTATQAKLLSFLQDFTLTRLGSTKPVRVNTRVIGATNRPLKELVEKGIFRADLYYRLSAVRFRLPALKDRREDIAPLCGHFLKEYNEKFGRSVAGFSPGALQRLLAHDWPGNVRELENTVQKAVLFCEADTVAAGQVEIQKSGVPGPGTHADQDIPRGVARALTREHVLALLGKNNNIVKWAARDARVSRVTLFRKMKKFGITRGGI